MALAAFLLQHNFKFDFTKDPALTDIDTTTDWLRIAAGINNIDPESNEETETTFYYDGGGMGETDVIGMTKTYSFEGHRKYGDPAQDYIFDELSHVMGEKRKGYFKITFPNGIIIHGKATVSNIKDPGGEANAKGEVSFDISFDGLPTKKLPEAQQTQG